MLEILKKVTTPKLILCLGTSIVSMAIIIVLFTLEVVSINKGYVTTIGLETKPSVQAASYLRAYLASFYADVANEVLTGTSIASSDSYVANIEKFTASLVQANKNITYKDEAYYVTNMQSSLAYLFSLFGEIRNKSIQEQTHDLVYRSNIEHLSLLATNLERANDIPLEKAYVSFTGNSKYLVYATILLGFVLLFTLGIAQILLIYKTRRLVNLPIAVATVIAVLSVGWCSYALIQERVTLRIAKVDAYNSLRDMYRLKANLYDMNTFESMWLLDKPHTFETQFFTRANQILSIDLNNVETTLVALRKALQFEQQGRDSAAAEITPKFTGLLGGELDNITFGVEERLPATQVVEMFVQYMRIDSKIRELENKGLHSEAIALCIGNLPGQSNYVFDRLLLAVDQVIQVNDSEFSSRIEQAMRLLKYIPIVSLSSLVLVMLLVTFGLWQRYQEYT